MKKKTNLEEIFSKIELRIEARLKGHSIKNPKKQPIKDLLEECEEDLCKPNR